jgi:hypothetical protein
MTSDNSVVSQLNITRVRVEDGGLYTCIAREGDHVSTHENRLDVYGKYLSQTYYDIVISSLLMSSLLWYLPSLWITHKENGLYNPRGLSAD